MPMPAVWERHPGCVNDRAPPSIPRSYRRRPVLIPPVVSVGGMEHTHHTRKAIAAISIAIAAGGLASCATLPEAGMPIVAHRELVRASADRYVEELLGRVSMHRELIRASADRYVEELLGRVSMHRRIVRAGADRYVDEQLERTRTGFCEPSTTEPAPADKPAPVACR